MVTFEKRIYREDTYEALRRRVELLEVRLRNVGLRVAGSSRLANYRRALESAEDLTIQSGAEPENQVLHRAILECSQLLLIVDELPKEPAVHGWSEKMQEVLSGHDLPHTERDKSHGRDTQFELYLAALARRAGYGVRLDEPDVVIEDGHGLLAIAAKRLKSPKKLRANLRSASRQITEGGANGFAALDLSMLLVPQDRPLLTEDVTSAQALYSSLLSDYIHSRAAKIRRSVNWRKVYGLLAVDTGLVIFTGSGKLAVLIQCRALNLCSEHDPRCRRIEHFAHGIGKIEIN